MGVLFICARTNTSVTMYNNGYGNFELFIIGAFSGIITVWNIAEILQSNRALSWCGINSIIIYVWQFILTQFF